MKPEQQQNKQALLPSAPCEDTLDMAMAKWFRSALGRYLLRIERRSVERAISRFFGYHQLDLMLNAELSVGSKSLLGHRIIAVPQPPVDRGQASAKALENPAKQAAIDRDAVDREGIVVCDSGELPFANDSINLIILHHTLDVTAHPHQTLREACRVLRSGGHIVIVGFNPLSFWGVRKLFSRRKNAPWMTRFLSPLRLEDWLNLLDVQPGHVSHKFYMPPIRSLSWLRRFGFLEKLGQRLRLPLGAFYTVYGQKRVAGSISFKPKWRRQALQGAAVVHQFTPHRKQ